MNKALFAICLFIVGKTICADKTPPQQIRQLSGEEREKAKGDLREHFEQLKKDYLAAKTAFDRKQKANAISDLFHNAQQVGAQQLARDVKKFMGYHRIN